MTEPVDLDALRVPMALHAEMARKGIAPHQLYPWHDPERGRVDPLDDPDVRASLRHLAQLVWEARRA